MKKYYECVTFSGKRKKWGNYNKKHCVFLFQYCTVLTFVSTVFSFVSNLFISVNTVFFFVSTVFTFVSTVFFCDYSAGFLNNLWRHGTDYK
jgi:hypothetical protein